MTPPDKISKYFLVTAFISEGVIYRTHTVNGHEPWAKGANKLKAGENGGITVKFTNYEG
ncbi:hypothetical protein [Alteromonas confluentis]|uniref:hypothetical protein n=1 Tax=Alteromonas confluentis TaxID=1656094 RepID=UPI00147D22E0|nr:hypothetical protein [Alteromonas confluentis]